MAEAPAKLNLVLEIVGKRPDQFHELRSLMVAVNLCDQLTFENLVAREIELSCDLPQLSVGPENLIVRAAKLLQQKTGYGHGARIELIKRIPWAAGLGGGSSDAAATLAGLSKLWNLNLSRQELASLGGELGSDIPFFFETPAAWCLGRGERVRSIPLGKTLHFVLVSPEVGLATVEVYRELGCTNKVEDVETAELNWESISTKIAEDDQKDSSRRTELFQALAEGNAESLARLLRNDLQEPAMRISPTVERWYRRLQTTKALGCLMSGSGSSLFALCRDHREALQIAQELHRGSPSEGMDKARISVVETCT